MPLDVGAAVPEFSVESHTGETVTREDLLGKVSVLFFYPKDSTPG